MTQTYQRQASHGGALPIPPLRKRIAFASPEIAITILFATVNSWYFYYLVNVAAIPPSLAGLAFAFGRIADAMLDPVVGRWIDARAPWRGRKRVVALALGPTAAFFVIIWIVPTLAEDAVLKAGFAALGFAAFALGYTLVTVPRLSMLPRYETDYHGRTAQIGVDMAFVFPTLMLAVAGVPALVAAIDGAGALSATMPRSWWYAAGALAAIACLAYLPFLAFVPEQRAQRAGHVPTKLPGAVIRAFRVSKFRRAVVTFFLSVIALASIQSMLPFFLESYIGLPKDRQAPVLGFVFAVSIVTLPLWVALGRRIGKIGGLIAGLAVFAAFLLFTATIVEGSGTTLPLFVAAGAAGASIAALSVFPWAIMPDAVDHHRSETGRSDEGLCVSIFTFSNKLATTGAVLLNGLILSLGGHVAGRAQQAPLATLAIFMATVCVPLLFAALCLIAAMILRNSTEPPARSAR